MLPDRVSNPGPLTYESDALPIALRGLETTTTTNEQVQLSSGKSKNYSILILQVHPSVHRHQTYKGTPIILQVYRSICKHISFCKYVNLQVYQSFCKDVN